MKLKIIHLVMTTLLTLALVGCSSSSTEEKLKPINGKLPDCPSSPNCVSTQASNPEKKMEPLAFKGDIEQSKQKILSIVNGMKRTKLIDQTEDTLHVTFTSAVFRFVDDVIFYFDEAEQVIHFRSSSRTGHSDFGVNQKRMSKISELYN